VGRSHSVQVLDMEHTQAETDRISSRLRCIVLGHIVYQALTISGFVNMVLDASVSRARPGRFDSNT
jgi:hypothetical protein